MRPRVHSRSASWRFRFELDLRPIPHRVFARFTSPSPMQALPLSRFLKPLGSAVIPAIAIALATAISPVQAQEFVLPTDLTEVEPGGEFAPEPTAPVPVRQPIGVFSLSGGQRLLEEASQAIGRQNYDLAAERLQQARRIFNLLSNSYQDLSSVFSGLNSPRSQSLRNNALAAAQLRDQSTYQLALVHRAQNQPDLAVPLLVQIIRSQGPTRDLGSKAVQQLVELGFLEDEGAPTPAVGGDAQVR